MLCQRIGVVARYVVLSGRCPSVYYQWSRLSLHVAHADILSICAGYYHFLFCPTLAHVCLMSCMIMITNWFRKLDIQYNIYIWKQASLFQCLCASLYMCIQICVLSSVLLLDSVCLYKSVSVYLSLFLSGSCRPPGTGKH